MMRTALIGYTGFVGGNIAAKHSFTDHYNSKNISEIEGKEYDLIVSAANRAEMWRINAEPEKDLAEINEFIEHISKVKIAKLVLISTVGVYKTAVDVDEDTVIDDNDLTPYGKHRFFLENFCAKQFDTTIVRLPGLYGQGLKKNVIFDFLNDNNVNRIHSASRYQFYDLGNLWNDIERALDHKLALLNIATPPISVAELSAECFGKPFNNTPEDVAPANWDMQTKYAKIFGQSGRYLYSREQEIAGITAFVKNYHTP